VTAEGLTYDTGALIAAERNDRLLWALHRAALARGLTPTVPTGVLAEAWRGGPQHNLGRVLKGCRTEALDEPQARRIGVLVAKSGLSDTVDVAVAEGAMRRNDAVVTSNRTHIEQVAEAAARRIVIHDL
jgi:predicted nucleic acid-binding protein